VGIVKYLRWREHTHRKWRMRWRQCVQSFYESSKTWSEMGNKRGQHAGNQEAEAHEDPVDFIILDTPSQRFGLLTSCSACALQSRAAFLFGKPSYLLYFWELADRHQLLQSSLQRLDNDVAASDAPSAPSATSTCTAVGCTRGRTQQDEQPQESAIHRIYLKCSATMKYTNFTCIQYFNTMAMYSTWILQ
jgi:hypothetical protein